MKALRRAHPTRRLFRFAVDGCSVTIAGSSTDISP